MAAFEEKVKKFNKFYLWLVIAVGAVCVAAIVTAIYLQVFVGVLVGICGAVAYLLLLSDEMKRSLGLWYRRTEGGIACSVIAPKKKGGETAAERYIPERLMWLEVVALTAPEGKDAPDAAAEVLYLPRTVKLIEADALSGMTSLVRIVYAGSAEEWAEVSCEAELGEIIIECGDGMAAPQDEAKQEDSENEIS